MKKKLLVFLAFVIACITVVTMLSFSAMAADEEVVITYQEKQSGGKKETAVPNADGTYTIKSTQLSGSGTVTMADGTVVNKELYGWFTEDGTFYDAGSIATFTESTTLYQAYGVTVTNFADLKKAFSAGGWVRLGCDIEGDNALTNGQTTSILDLNGFNYTCTNNQNASWGAELGVFGCTRGSYAIMGKGTITQGTRTKDTSNGKFFASFSTHSFYDENNPQDFWIGKDVKIVTPYPLLRLSNQPKLDMPDMRIAGTIEAQCLLTGPSMQRGTVKILESADITITGTEMITITTLNANPYTYLTVTIHGGKIKMAAENSQIVTDTMKQCCEINILGGSFAISDSGIANLTPYIVEPLVLKETVDGEVTYKTVSEPDCMHNFVLDAEASVTATKTENGKDVYACSVCGETKESITVYNPSSVEITIKVLVGEEIVEKTVALDSVATIVKKSVEADAYYEITAFAQADSEGNKLLSVQVPFGIKSVSLTGANNTTIEEIEILDGADTRVYALYAMQTLKTLRIGAATVAVNRNALSTNNKAFTSVISDKAGATVTFDVQAFYYYDTCPVNELVLTAGSTYNFGESCFAKSQLESVIFPDGATVNFTGNSAFNNSSNLKYVYCGDGVTKLNYRPFEYLYNLETVVVMNSATFEDCAFRVDDNDSTTTVLSVYVHTADITNIHKNAFYKRNDYGVKFYTIDPDITSLQNCLYTIYNGIPHGYVDGVVREATCVLPGIVGSTTDCACGVNTVTTYTIYTAEGTTTGSTEQRETELSKVHVLGTVLANISYANGFDANGTKEYYCAVCGTATMVNEEEVATPIFQSLGYSISEGAYGGLVLGFYTDTEAMDEYKSTTGNEVEYGVFVVLGATIGDSDIFGADGKSVAGVVSAKVSTNETIAFDLKIIGFNDDEKKAKELVMGAFVEVTKDGVSEYSYVQDEKPAEGAKYSLVTYNQIATRAE